MSVDRQATLMLDTSPLVADCFAACDTTVGPQLVWPGTLALALYAIDAAQAPAHLSSWRASVVGRLVSRLGEVDSATSIRAFERAIAADVSIAMWALPFAALEPDLARGFRVVDCLRSWGHGPYRDLASVHRDALFALLLTGNDAAGVELS